MSGWWFASSATSATRFTKSIAAAEVAEAELPLERVVRPRSSLPERPCPKDGTREPARAGIYDRSRGRGPSHAA